MRVADPGVTLGLLSVGKNQKDIIDWQKVLNECLL